MKSLKTPVPDTDDSADDSTKDRDHKVAKGAKINILGNIGKLLFPLYGILVTRFFGPDVMGSFMLAFVSLEIIGNVTVSGFNDGVLMFASRALQGEPDEDSLYRTLANGFVVTLVLSSLVILLAQLLGPWIIATLFPEKDLWPVLQILLWTLPIISATTIAVAATKSLMLMQWEALLVNTLRPFLLVVLMTIWYVMGARTPLAIAWSYLLAVSIVGVLTAIVFSRYFSLNRLWHHIHHFDLARDLLRFAIPQNINMTFYGFITRIDVVMLGIFGLPPARIGFYGIGAQIVSNLSQVQGSIAGAYAPAIARQHVAGDRQGLNQSFTMVSRWAVTILWPIAFGVIFFRPELLRVFHPSFAGASIFMLILAVRPIVNSGLGISGNIIVMTGYSQWNLFNSVTVAVLNIGLNLLLIPHYGLRGAAGATTLSSMIVIGLQLIELHILLDVHSLVGRLYKPYLAAIPGIVAILIYASTPETLRERIIACMVAIGAYLAILFILGIEREDREMFFSRWTR